MIDQNPAIRQASVSPSVRTLIGNGNLLSGFTSDLTRHYMIATAFGILPVPYGCVGSIPCPRLVEICISLISQLMKASTIDINNTDDRLPFTHIRIILNPTKENEHVSRLGPGRLEIPMTGSEWLAFRRAENIYMNLAVLIIRRSVPRFI